MPITEVDYVRAGLGIRQTDLNIGTIRREYYVPNEDDPDNPTCVDINENGICPEIFFGVRPGDPLSTSLDHNGDGFLDDGERDFRTYDFTASWSRDTRNHFLNPTRGSSQRLALEASLPGSTREFYKIFYRYAKYIPIWATLVFSFHGDIGYGDAYDDYDNTSQAVPVRSQTIAYDEDGNIIYDEDGNIVYAREANCLEEEVMYLDTNLPFFEHFYGGGVRDIRGFEDNTLGPKDGAINCRATGGDLKVSGGLELAIPTPFTQGGGSRIALFVDFGNVYENLDAFDASLFMASAGISVTWQAPVGPIIMNYAIPLKEFHGDRTESLQFSFGTTF